MATFLLLSIISWTWGGSLPTSPIDSFVQWVNQDYLPLTASELSHRFPVKYLGTKGDQPFVRSDTMQDSPLPERIEIGPSGANVTRSDSGRILITGKDKNGYAWNVDLGDFALAEMWRFYSADLDRNGIRDLVLIYPTLGNGLAPTSYFFSLTFDEQGRPVPFKAAGYFEDSVEGIRDLVDLDGDGRAELIYMNFDDGYWITNLYQVQGARWQRVRGKHGYRSYPLYTRFTYRPNRKSVVPAPGRHSFAADQSNKEPCIQGQLSSFQWMDPASSETIDLVVKTGKGRKVTSNLISWDASFIVVSDSIEERTIVSLWDDDEERIKAVLSKIVAGAYQVSFFGDRRGNRLGSDILWISLPATAPPLRSDHQDIAQIPGFGARKCHDSFDFVFPNQSCPHRSKRRKPADLRYSPSNRDK